MSSLLSECLHINNNVFIIIRGADKPFHRVAHRMYMGFKCCHRVTPDAQWAPFRTSRVVRRVSMDNPARIQSPETALVCVGFFVLFPGENRHSMPNICYMGSHACHRVTPCAEWAPFWASTVVHRVPADNPAPTQSPETGSNGLGMSLLPAEY